VLPLTSTATGAVVLQHYHIPLLIAELHQARRQCPASPYCPCYCHLASVPTLEVSYALLLFLEGCC
jgi:hypothetical protein